MADAWLPHNSIVWWITRAGRTGAAGRARAPEVRHRPRGDRRTVWLDEGVIDCHSRVSSTAVGILCTKQSEVNERAALVDSFEFGAPLLSPVVELPSPAATPGGTPQLSPYARTLALPLADSGVSPARGPQLRRQRSLSSPSVRSSSLSSRASMIVQSSRACGA
jgi:hypothetical protein